MRGSDPRIRIRTKMSRMRYTDKKPKDLQSQLSLWLSHELAKATIPGLDYSIDVKDRGNDEDIYGYNGWMLPLYFHIVLAYQFYLSKIQLSLSTPLTEVQETDYNTVSSAER